MRRKDKIEKRKERLALHEHKQQMESERGWAGQHGQHPESKEEENYQPETSSMESPNNASTNS